MVVNMGCDVAHDSFEAVFGKDANADTNESKPSEYIPLAPTAELAPSTIPASAPAWILDYE